MGRSEVNKERDQKILEDRKAGMTAAQLGEKYGISYQRVCQIIGPVRPRRFHAQKDGYYPNLTKWMNENKITAVTLAEMIYGYRCSGNETRVRDWLRGRTDPRKRTIDIVLQITGMSYEVAFYKEGL